MCAWKCQEEYILTYVTCDRPVTIEAFGSVWNIIIDESCSNYVTVLFNLVGPNVKRETLIQVTITSSEDSWIKDQVSSFRIFQAHMRCVRVQLEKINKVTYYNVRIKFYTQRKASVSKEQNVITESEIHQKSLRKQDESENYSPANFSYDFSNNLHRLQQKGKYADVSLRCDTKIFKAHRIILSAASPVLEARLQNSTKEGLNQEIDIEDMKPEVLHLILGYIYSKKDIQDSNSIDLVFDIFRAADKYMLGELKNSCIKRLKSIISVTNALQILVFADLHDVSLREHVVQFACNEYYTLRNSPEWKDLEEQNPSLIMDIMIELPEDTN